jgi:16S rRNA (guanine(966)-N(2))-methyltransferase RsmD
VAPKNLPVRPTTDFAKEGLFNVLANRIEIDGASVMDLCAGTGNMSLEFASRGASKIIAVDQHPGCIKFIQKMVRELDFDSFTVIRSELFKFIQKMQGSYDIIFADPPYGIENTEKLPDLILEKKVLNEDGFLILEHAKDYNFEKHSNFCFSKRYGNVNFTFFQY